MIKNEEKSAITIIWTLKYPRYSYQINIILGLQSKKPQVRIELGVFLKELA